MEALQQRSLSPLAGEGQGEGLAAEGSQCLSVARIPAKHCGLGPRAEASQELQCLPMNTDANHRVLTFLHRFRAHTLRLSSVQSVALSIRRYEGEPRSFDGCDEGVLATSIIHSAQAV